MITTIADQYLAQNAGRRYPFADDTPDMPGLPDSAVLDFHVSVYGRWDTAIPTAALQRVTREHGIVGIHVEMLQAQRTAAHSIHFSAPEEAFQADVPVTLRVSNSELCAAITVTSAILDAQIPHSAYREFAPTTVTFRTCGVDSIQAVGGERLDGEIVLAPGYNVDPYLDGNRLRLDVSKGGGIGEYCQQVSAGTQTCANVLFSINGERPGTDGDIVISGHDGVVVSNNPAAHAIEISVSATARTVLSGGCSVTCA